MNTLTVTYHHTTNYGAVLQAYALQQTLISLGHENVILETKDVVKEKKGKSFNIRSLYLDFLSWLRRKENNRLKDYFAIFHEKKLLLTRPYTNMSDLKSDCPEADCLITGSDQVWKFSTTPRFLDARLLKFGKESAIRFSYAASMEELCYSDEQKAKLRDALSNYKGISVREQSAKEYIESFTPYNCLRVLDPVFLLSKERWHEFSKEPRIKGPFILCYQVQRNKRMADVAYQIKKKTGFPIVSICNTPIKWMRSDYTFYDVPIEEFIGFYQSASYVVSASFHGVALGIVFEKPVYALIKNARSNRIKDLMHLFELDKFVEHQDNKGQVALYGNGEIDNTIRIKEHNISLSLDYLRKMLG